MKKMKVGATAVVLAVSAVASMQASSAFATNSYGINYDGGSALSSSNVQINPSLINGLTSLVKYGGSEGNTVSTSSSSGAWSEGYIKTSVCHKISYLKVVPGQAIAQDVSYRVTKSPYSIRVGLSKVEVDGFSLADGKDFVPVAVSHVNGALYVGTVIYSDSGCSNQVTEAEKLTGSNGKIFVETNIKVYENNQKLISDGLYFGITDIDAGQSFKILNNNNLLTQSNMYAESSEALQPSSGSDRNMYNSSGNYIYSQGSFNLDNSNIFVSVDEAVLNGGLNVVFGFASPAGSGVEYYAKQFVVKYVSDDNGSITGIGEEDIISGRNPSGSSSKPKEDFEFAYWKADVDVTLGDGTTVEAGNKLTSDQVKQVVVEENITFTAIHEDSEDESVSAPDTGAFTSTESLTPVILSISGIAVVALIAGLLPKFAHKKVKFD